MVGDILVEISWVYVLVIGMLLMMLDYVMGFWQCKFCYCMQEELLEVVCEYKCCNLFILVIVIDFFYWLNQGDWMFDVCDWFDFDVMIVELKLLGIELMVFVWLMVDNCIESYWEMCENGWLV